MRELPRFPGKLRVAKALLGNLEGPGTEEALCPPSQVECHLVKQYAQAYARAHTHRFARNREVHTSAGNRSGRRVPQSYYSRAIKTSAVRLRVPQKCRSGASYSR